MAPSGKVITPARITRSSDQKVTISLSNAFPLMGTTVAQWQFAGEAVSPRADGSVISTVNQQTSAKLFTFFTAAFIARL